MRLQWLLAYLCMCGYSCTICAVIANTGEVIRIAPLRFYGILGTALFVKSLVKNFNFAPGHPEVIEFIENPVRFNMLPSIKNEV